MFKNNWFQNRQAIKTLPLECINDCSGRGCVDDMVEYWVRKLNFDGPSWLFREYLKEYGAWTEAQLCNHLENRRRVLWLWAVACNEDRYIYEYLYLGV
jgi:hypothetical protein